MVLELLPYPLALSSLDLVETASSRNHSFVSTCNVTTTTKLQSRHFFPSILANGSLTWAIWFSNTLLHHCLKAGEHIFSYILSIKYCSPRLPGCHIRSPSAKLQQLAVAPAIEAGKGGVTLGVGGTSSFCSMTHSSWVRCSKVRS